MTMMLLASLSFALLTWPVGLVILWLLLLYGLVWLGYGDSPWYHFQTVLTAAAGRIVDPIWLLRELELGLRLRPSPSVILQTTTGLLLSKKRRERCDFLTVCVYVETSLRSETLQYAFALVYTRKKSAENSLLRKTISRTRFSAFLRFYIVLSLSKRWAQRKLGAKIETCWTSGHHRSRQILVNCLVAFDARICWYSKRFTPLAI